ncbi:ZN273 protein, partial [Bombycilla garrulus]|nr:ZN273 protein [Bombycilla garrulus]
CHEGSQRSRQISELVLHGQVPDVEKPHKGLECGRIFSWSSSLRKHERIHTGER